MVKFSVDMNKTLHFVVENVCVPWDQIKPAKFSNKFQFFKSLAILGLKIGKTENAIHRLLELMLATDERGEKFVIFFAKGKIYNFMVLDR